MKKVLIFSLAYYPETVGGAEVAIKEITDRIDSNDIEFHMVTLRYNRKLPRVEKIGNVLVHRIGFAVNDPTPEDLKKFPLHYNKYFYELGAAWTAHKLHAKYHYDGIWAMMAHSTGIPAALFKMFHAKVPYVLTLQEGDPTDYIERTMRPVWPLFTRAFTTADVVQPISDFLGEWARRRGFTGPLEIIHNGANARDFQEQTPAAEIDDLKKKVGKKEGDVYLVTTSRLVHKNGIDDVIKSLTHLPKNISFLVVGGGPDEELLKKLAVTEGVSDRVIFTGQVERTETPKYRRISDIFVRPSRSEGLGNSFASAMAANLPIIATQEGGIAEFLFDAKRNPDKPTTGWAVDADSPAQIAESVKDILANPKKVKEVTATARSLAFEKYNWDSIAKDMRSKVFGRVL
jgi:glycosyltransferase involved in cell wall biosynthesis